MDRAFGQQPELPIEWLIQVFTFLPINQVIPLRAVCKEWLYAVDHFVLTELSISICDEQRPPKQTELLKFSNAYLSYKQCLCYAGVEILDNLHRLVNVFRNLKTLIFSENIQGNHEAQGLRAQIFINSLENLTHLELRKYKFNLISSIKLERLRRLSIHHDQSSKSNFINIYCPNLVQFATNATNWTPRSCYFMPHLKMLICEKFDDWVRNLKELETLMIRKIEPKDESLLVYLPKLKHLDIYRAQKDDLLAILNGREAFRRDDLTICYGAIPIHKHEINERLKLKATAFSKVQSKLLVAFYSQHHPQMPTDLYFLSTLKILNRMKAMAPAFYRRLSGVREVIVATDSSKHFRQDPLCQQDLFRVLSELPLVQVLTINAKSLVDLSPSFFRILPKFCQLVTLTVHGERGAPAIVDGFGFLLQMNQISQFAFYHSCYNHPYGQHYFEMARRFSSSNGRFRLEAGRGFLVLLRNANP